MKKIKWYYILILILWIIIGCLYFYEKYYGPEALGKVYLNKKIQSNEILQINLFKGYEQMSSGVFLMASGSYQSKGNNTNVYDYYIKDKNGFVSLQHIDANNVKFKEVKGLKTARIEVIATYEADKFCYKNKNHKIEKSDSDVEVIKQDDKYYKLYYTLDDHGKKAIINKTTIIYLPENTIEKNINIKLK